VVVKNIRLTDSSYFSPPLYAEKKTPQCDSLRSLNLNPSCQVLTVSFAAEITLASVVKAKVIKKVFRCECAFHIIHEPFMLLSNTYSVHSFLFYVKKTGLKILDQAERYTI
jgi:hypothetical protein